MYGDMTTEEQLTQEVLTLKRNLRVCHQALYNTSNHINQDDSKGMYTIILRILRPCLTDGNCPNIISGKELDALEQELEVWQ